MIALAAVTFLAFATLKVTENVDWPWWVVSSPLWGVASLYFLVLVFALPALIRRTRAIVEEAERRS